jgi:hypothetical protein
MPFRVSALKSGIRKMLDGLAGLRVAIVSVSGPGPFRNINTPRDWLEYTSSQTDKTSRGED